MTTSAAPNTADKPAEAPPAARPALAITPRRRLPSGRALLGAVLITAAAAGAFAVATRGEAAPNSRYLVLTGDVESGDEISLNDVVSTALVLSPELESTALQSTEGLEGATALRLLRSGSILDVRDLNGAAFVDGAPVVDIHELTLPVPRDRAPALLRRGDRVTLLAFDDADGMLRIAVEDALVLAFEGESQTIGSSDQARLTLALPDAALVVETTLRSYDSLTVVLTSRAIDDVYVVPPAPTATDET